MNDLKTCIAAAVSGRSAEVSIFSRDCALSGGMRGAGGGEGGVDKSTPGGLRELRIKDHVQHAAEGAADFIASRIPPGPGRGVIGSMWPVCRPQCILRPGG